MNSRENRVIIILTTILFVLILIFATILPLACSNASDSGEETLKVTRNFELMGTFFTIKVLSKDKEKAEEAIKKAYDRALKIDQLMSTYKKDSEVSRLNKEGHCQVSEGTLFVIKKSIEISKVSKGAFDITVGPLVKLWKSKVKKKSKELSGLPTKKEIEEAKAKVDYKNIILDEQNSNVKFKKKGMTIDLGGIAKGYALDEIVRVLKENDIKSGLIEGGGDLFVFGSYKEGKGWPIGIQDPTLKKKSLKRLRVKDRAITTSGNYRRYSTYQGKRYSHILDPRTGQPVIETVLSTTVIAKNATLADGLATALNVLGPKEGIALAESLKDVEVLFIVKRDSSTEFKQSSGFSNYVEE